MRITFSRGVSVGLLAGVLALAPSAIGGATGVSVTATVGAHAKYEAQIKAIDKTFHAAVDNAKAAYKTATTLKVTPTTRAAAKVTYKAALASARATYEAAISVSGVTAAAKIAARTALAVAKKAAHTAYETSISGKVSASTRLSARLAERAAIAAAVSARAAAIAALGPAPSKGHHK